MERHARHSSVGFLARATCVLLLPCSAAAAVRHFDLPEGDARIQLNEFSRQADLQVLDNFPELRGMRSHAVRGDFEPIDALRMLLDGLPLKWDWVNERTLAIRRRKPATTYPET